jgi:tetratricopeptide (TPR) repeat protein
MDQGEFARAAEILRENIRAGSDDVRTYYFLADALTRQGLEASSPAYKEALDAVEASLKIDPEFANGYLERGKLRLISHETADAIADFERARTLAPDDRAVAYELATAFRAAGRKGEAEKLYAEVASDSNKEDAKYREGELIQTIVKLSSLSHAVN